jgi:hypothetical protein
LELAVVILAFYDNLPDKWYLDLKQVTRVDIMRHCVGFIFMEQVWLNVFAFGNMQTVRAVLCRGVDLDNDLIVRGEFTFHRHRVCNSCRLMFKTEIRGHGDGV